MTSRDEWGGQVADAIAVLMQRSTRAHLYGILTEGVAPGVNEATYPVLSGLDRKGPRSAATLATEIGIDRSVTSRHATRLEEAGLLRRAPDPSDRRATLLVLTPRGERAVEVMRERLAHAVGDYLTTWDAAEADAFVTSLTRFVEEGPWGQDTT
ncbi:MarR family transcriptional regulator [Streptomyces sp. NPDC048290]|uniref:MarR family winged helix-turn-helix transcriptional regulator n=1 Tax=Streptomyces sp. NPDC048290 TaxID=3155811 RepID=UPI003437A3A5